MSFLILFLVFVLLTLVILYILWKRAFDKLPKEIPNAPFVPIFGSVFDLNVDSYELRKKLIGYGQKYNHLYAIWQTSVPFLQIGCTEYAECFLTTNNEQLKKSFLYDFLRCWLGNGLLLSKGEKWRKRRKMITPTFHFSILKQFEYVIIKQAKVFVSKLKTFAESGEGFDVQSMARLATLDIICETAMGVSKNVQMNEDSPYANSILTVTRLIERRCFSPWLWSDIWYPYTFSGREFYSSLKVVHSFSREVINDRITRRKKLSTSTLDNEPNKAFLDILIEQYEKGEIDSDGIQEEVDTFMFEGHDTTTSALSWTLYCLGKYPNIQRKLHAEIDTMSYEDDNVIEEIKNLKYLEYVLKESMRLHPPVPVIARCLEQDTIVNGQLLPAGLQALINVYDLHTNPAYWNEPYKFRPERFSEEENFHKRNPYCYIPFSAGPRNCVGQRFAMLEEKILLFFIMKNFELKMTEKEVRPIHEAVLRSENGIYMKVNRRT